MSIATALTALNSDVVNARNKIVEMGGAVTPNGGTSQLSADIATIPQGGGEPTITIVSPTTTCMQIADALRAAVSASITHFIAIRELPHGVNECIAVCWSESKNSRSIDRNDSSYGYMRRFNYGGDLAPVPQGAVFKIYDWGD